MNLKRISTTTVLSCESCHEPTDIREDIWLCEENGTYYHNDCRPDDDPVTKTVTLKDDLRAVTSQGK